MPWVSFFSPPSRTQYITPVPALQAKSAVSAAARRTRRRPPGVGRACWAAIAASCCAPQAAPMAASASPGQQATLRPMACTPGGLPPAASWWLLRNTSQKALSRRVYAPLRCAQTLREKSPFLRSVASQSLLAVPGLRLAGVRSLARLGVPKARRARPGCGCAAAALPAGGTRSVAAGVVRGLCPRLFQLLQNQPPVILTGGNE